MNKLPRTVGLISNPNSGHNRDQFADLRKMIDDSPVIHKITQSATEVEAALRSLAAEKVSILGINGGDGTISAILGQVLDGRFFDAPPQVVVLPGGTANMNAGDVGMNGKLSSAVKRFCAHADQADWSKADALVRPLLRVTTEDGAIHYGMFLGAGAVISGTAYAHEKIHAKGLRDDFSLALGTVRTVLGVVRGDPRFAQHQNITVRLDHGETHTYETLILAISSLHRLAFGMRPFWGDEEGGLRLTLMRRGCSRFARTFFQIARGKPGRNAVPEQGYISHNANVITLAMEGEINLDGEIVSVAGHARIEATPELTFLRF